MEELRWQPTPNLHLWIECAVTYCTFSVTDNRMRSEFIIQIVCIWITQFSVFEDAAMRTCDIDTRRYYILPEKRQFIGSHSSSFAWRWSDDASILGCTRAGCCPPAKTNIMKMWNSCFERFDFFFRSLRCSLLVLNAQQFITGHVNQSQNENVLQY